MESSVTPLSEADRLLVFDFLRALYRPMEGSRRIIIDPDAEEGWRNIPFRKRHAELSTRLALLRTTPRDTVRIRIYSGDEGLNSETLTVDFHRITGRLDVVPLSRAPATPDIYIDVRHWPEGTRLVCVTALWLGDRMDDIFHNPKGERVYRFAVSSIPLD